MRKRGVTFAVVVVKGHVTASATEADRTIAAFQPIFPGVPVVLMRQDGWGRAAYYGRRDIARFMASVPGGAVSWRRYTV